MSHLEPTEFQVAEVIARTRAGSSSALATVYTWYAQDLLRLLTRLLASHDDAQDVVHDLFVGLPEHLARYEERGSFRGWLRATAVGMARMRTRKETRRANVLARDAVHARSLAHQPLLTLDLERAVDGLPDVLRQVFVLKQWEGYSHDEIATLLEISPGASRVRHSRALVLLRSQLDR